MPAEPESPDPPRIEPLAESDLAARFALPLELFAVRRLGDAAAAEEVAQETLRRGLEALRRGRLRDVEALPSFLFQTARHVCLHRRRATGREERALARLAREPGHHRGEPLDDPLASLVRGEQRRRVARALARLEPSDRRLLRALYHEEEEPARVAGRLGISSGTLRVRKHRALQRLRQLLAEES